MCATNSDTKLPIMLRIIHRLIGEKRTRAVAVECLYQAAGLWEMCNPATRRPKHRILPTARERQGH